MPTLTGDDSNDPHDSTLWWSIMFFDDYPRFLETSETATQLDRLNWRHVAIIEDNQDLLDGARVLDIASHDGRWSFAAIKAGAQHVTGIEGNPGLVANAHDNMAWYGVPEDRYRFDTGDVFDALAGEHGIQVDVALCLGFLYHTLRYPELFKAVHSVGAKHLIIDTSVLKSNRGRVVRLVSEDVTKESSSIDNPLAHARRALSGWPTETALDFLLTMFGFEVVKKFDWPTASAQQGIPPPAYRNRRRVTWVARRL